MDICANLRIELNKEIGYEGRNSKVFKGYDPQLNAHMVVKQVPKSNFNNPEEYFAEAQMLYLTQHPFVMEINYAAEDQDHIYFSMPYCKNGSISSIIERRFLTVREIIKYSLDFLSGLHYIHSKNLVHFDVKPTNILIGNSNKAIITDFGLAKYVDDDSGLAEQDIFYTIHRPPESYLTNQLSNVSDIYQAGLTIYRMCNGDDILRKQLSELNITTYPKLMYAVLNGTFPNRSFFLPHIPKKLQSIIKKALSVKTEERYETILDMINDLSNVDENLDWCYNIDQNTCSETWSIKNASDTHLIKIHLNKNSNSWNITGKKIRLKDSKTTNINKLGLTRHNNRQEALKHIAKIIKDFS